MEYSLVEVRDIAKRLLQTYKDKQIFLFTGDLGAGKTTLIKELCLQLGVTENISSPTFSIVNQYESNEVGTVYHMDLYRLQDAEEAVNIGMEDYLDSGAYILIEWPQIIDHWFEDEVLRIHIENVTEEKRKIVFL